MRLNKASALRILQKNWTSISTITIKIAPASQARLGGESNRPVLSFMGAGLLFW
jgi:hypothetical protein